MSPETTTVPSWTPPKWLNSMMTVTLRTPGLERLVGRTTALITVTGRRTGTKYTTPVTYYRDGNSVIIITKRFRTWWRNLDANPEVELRLAGIRYRGAAHLSLDDPASLAHLIAFLGRRRRDARAHGISFTSDGHPDERQALSVLPHLVIITITLMTGESNT